MTAKTMAKIDLWVATSADISAAYEAIKSQVPETCDPVCGSWEDPTDQDITCVGDATGICMSWGANQYRYNGFLAVRDGHIPAYRTCVMEINDGSGGSMPFIKDLVFPTQDYIVYGKAENFTVPEDGDYSFWVRQSLQLWIFIDGKLVNNALNGAEQALANYTGEVLGEVDLDDPLLADSKTAYQTHGVNLTEGTHTFELYYSASGNGTEQQAILRWQTPSMRTENPDDWQVVPAQAFGSTPCPLPPEAEITTVEADGEALVANQSVCLQDNVEYTFTGAFLNAPDWAEDIAYVWTMGDQTIVETAEPVITHTYSAGSFASFPYQPSLIVHYNDRYQTPKATSPFSVTVIDHPDCVDGVVGTKVPVASFTNGRAVAQFRNNLILNNSRNSDMRVAVYSLSGKLLAQTSVRPGVTAEMKMSNLSKGLYLVKAFAGSELIDTQSFVRQ